MDSGMSNNHYSLALTLAITTAPSQPTGACVGAQGTSPNTLPHPVSYGSRWQEDPRLLLSLYFMAPLPGSFLIYLLPFLSESPLPQWPSSALSLCDSM